MSEGVAITIGVIVAVIAAVGGAVMKIVNNGKSNETQASGAQPTVPGDLPGKVAELDTESRLNKQSIEHLDGKVDELTITVRTNHDELKTVQAEERRERRENNATIFTKLDALMTEVRRSNGG